MKITFENGKAVIKSGRKIIAKVFDREVFYAHNNIARNFSDSEKFSLEMMGGIFLCESVEKCIELLEKYS